MGGRSIPLLEAVGPQGVFILAWGWDRETAEKMAAEIDQYRPGKGGKGL